MNDWCIVCSVYVIACCQKDTQEQRNTPGRKPKPIKPKLGKSTNKESRAVTAKPKIKATAAAQTVLTQVSHI